MRACVSLLLFVSWVAAKRICRWLRPTLAWRPSPPTAWRWRREKQAEQTPEQSVAETVGERRFLGGVGMQAVSKWQSPRSFRRLSSRAPPVPVRRLLNMTVHHPQPLHAITASFFGAKKKNGPARERSTVNGEHALWYGVACIRLCRRSG